MSFVSLIESVSLFVPLSTMAQGWRDVATSRDFPNITYNPENFYQTSAILATFLETISLKYRAKDLLQPMILADFCSDLSAYGLKMSAANLGLPFNMSTACDTLEQPKHIFTHLTPNSEVSRGQMMQTVVRGIHRSQIAALEPRASSSVLSVFPYADASLKMQKYLERFDSANVIPVMTCETPMPVKVPYPEEIFAKIISAATSGSQYLTEKPLRISSIPVLAGITSTKHLMGTIDSLHVEAEKVKLGKLCRFRETGLESDEYTEVLHKLLDFRDLYDDRVAL
uniref:Putative member of tubulin/ftsz family n=1 Tax=Lutzomyia longipalpis TaxID=7200 RepID=A0A7G3ART7_LUTLO